MYIFLINTISWRCVNTFKDQDMFM